jgi:transcriptional regulator
VYLPPQFKAPDPGHALTLMREYPLAQLVSVDDEGLPWITPLPLHVQARGDALVLLGHVARPNPHWRFLQARPRARVSFMGPHAYMSPAVYPDLARVPTWNYLTVQCTVQATLIDAAHDKDRLLKCLIADHEPAYADQWRAMDPDLAQRLLSGIVAFELAVTDLQCKLKLNQHRPESHAALHQRYAQGTPDEQALARWMERLGQSGAGAA